MLVLYQFDINFMLCCKTLLYQISALSQQNGFNQKLMVLSTSMMAQYPTKH